MKRWNETEEKALKQNASTMTAKQIGYLLGRTEKSVSVRAAIIGVCMRKSGDAHHSRKYSEADIDIARQLHDAGMGLRLIAEKLEIPAASLKNYFY
ncbi:DNA-binding protein [Serratia sp. JSRIV001]|uniref:DNA-binding protein n=1 Tax=Serratia sp. JSRIV001 TaxID=2831893 RepID=UPI001CBE1995|nr:DNA-binding protein [Serratia sp. JSRIV001]UAN43865.1 DNA-binding protein [Serratia sp. JSRIV001]